jgi:hypothetical protein
VGLIGCLRGVATRGKQAAWDVRAGRKTADRHRFASKLSRGLNTIDRLTLQEAPCHPWGCGATISVVLRSGTGGGLPSLLNSVQSERAQWSRPGISMIPFKLPPSFRILHGYRSTYKQKKWPPRRERPLLCRETVLGCLLLQEASRHTERAEGCAQQHYRRSTIRNLATRRSEEFDVRDVLTVEHHRS